MQHICVLIVTGAIASLSSILILGLPVDAQTSPTAAEKRDGPSSEATAIAPKVKDTNFYLSDISKAIVDEASRLQNDAAGWGQKLQELELDLSRTSKMLGRPRRTSTSAYLCYERLPIGWRLMKQLGR